MKNNAFKKLVTVFAFVGMLAAFSSCNRGYGCPNNFSLDTTITTIVKTTVDVLVRK